MWERPAIRRRRKGRRRTASRGRASTGASGGSSILPRSSGFRAIWQISRKKATSSTVTTVLRWRPSDTMTAGRSCPLWSSTRKATVSMRCRGRRHPGRERKRRQRRKRQRQPLLTAR